MPQEDHDQRLKTAVKSKFSEAIDLLLPDWVSLFDFAKLEWLEQEIFPDPPAGTRRAIDILAKMPTFQPITTAAGEPPAEMCVGLVHVELEGWDPLAVMRQRMRDYRHYLSRKYQLPVLPLCIYLHVGLQGQGWDEYRETFFGEVIDTFRYRYLGLPALDGLHYIQGSNLLGVALASLMRIAADAKAKAKADALQKIASSAETEVRKYLLCECVEAYLPLEEVQMNEYEQLLVTPPYQGARKYGKTSFELGHEQGQLTGEQKLLREQLAHRFGPLSEEVSKRLQSCSEAQLLDLARRVLTASSLRELGLEP
jgi:hypothetical protein